MVRDFLVRHPFLRRAVLALFIYYCLHGAVLEIAASRQYKQVAGWPMTEGRITSSEVYWRSYSWSRGKTNRYCPKLGYTYTVQGRTYAEFNRVFDFTCWPDAYDYVAQHKPGSAIQIAHDPNHPALTIVPSTVHDPGLPWGDVLGGLIFIGVLLFDIFGGWLRENRQDSLESNNC